MYCKTQSGATVLGVAAGAPFTITIAIANFSYAKVKGLVMVAYDPALGIDHLREIELTSIAIQGTENINPIVTADRYNAQATGSGGGAGTKQAFRGAMGSSQGTMVIIGTNRSAVTLNINATIDINAVRSA